MENFWLKLKEGRKPFFGLAPMLDVTDAPFRAMFAKYGKPDVLWTEFVSADGLCSRGREKLLPMLKFTEAERPIVAQIFGANPQTIREASALIAELGFDGVDINMGCPDKSVLKQGAGAALINTPELAREIIQAAIAGVHSTSRPIPVSVKTRTGFNRVELEKWIPELIKENISALTIHGRTKKEMSLVPARWGDIARVVEIVKASGRPILVIGNGDVHDMADGEARARATGCDGVMIGRGAFGKPWLFNKNESAREVSLKKRFEILLEHTKLFEETFGGDGGNSGSVGNGGSVDRGGKNFAMMKKHYKAYVNGFPGASDLRVKLMEVRDYREIEKIVGEFVKGLD